MRLPFGAGAWVARVFGRGKRAYIPRGDCLSPVGSVAARNSLRKNCGVPHKNRRRDSWPTMPTNGR
jgi:hypothetical protein